MGPDLVLELLDPPLVKLSIALQVFHPTLCLHPEPPITVPSASDCRQLKIWFCRSLDVYFLHSSVCLEDIQLEDAELEQCEAQNWPAEKAVGRQDESILIEHRIQPANTHHSTE